MPFETISKKTIEYLSVPSVVGHEWAFMRYLERDFDALGLNVEWHGSAIEISGTKPLSKIITAHADRHGLISLGEGEYAYAAQYMKEIKYGENNVSSINALKDISRRFQGEDVFAYDPNSGNILEKGTIESCLPCMENGDSVFWVNGMTAQDINTPLAYARTAEVKGIYLKGQIDNAISIAFIHDLFSAGFEGTALITTEEEIGYSWQHIQNWLERKNIETQELYVLDTSPFKDSDPVKDGQIIFRNRDKSAEFNTAMVSQLVERCKRLGLPYQIKDQKMLAAGATTNQLGSTELGRLVLNTQGRWSGATIQIPTLEYHTSFETTSAPCIENFFEFLRAIFIGS